MPSQPGKQLVTFVWETVNSGYFKKRLKRWFVTHPCFFPLISIRGLDLGVFLRNGKMQNLRNREQTAWASRQSLGDYRHFYMEPKKGIPRSCQKERRERLPTSNQLFFKGHVKLVFGGIYEHMGMALKTVWIVPRWSGRLERGGYVKGHDPEVSKAPTRRSCFHVMTSYLYMSLWLGQRSHGRAEKSSYSVQTSDSTWL